MKELKPPPAVVTPPLAIVILAVLNLLVGVGGILVTPFSLLSVLAAPDPAVTGAPPSLQGLSYFALIGSYCSSVLLIASGIGLLRTRPWAWWMAIGCAVFALASFTVTRVVLLAMSVLGGADREAYAMILAIGTALLCVPSFFHPILTLFVLLPQAARERFAAPRAAGGTFPEAFRPAASLAADSTHPAGQQSTGDWLARGPDLPAYQPSGGESAASWKWAILIAPTSFAVLLLATVGMFASFGREDAPPLIMGIAALGVGSFGLAGALFEWQRFFASRQARGLRWWLGDRRARWIYVGISVFVLLVGYRLVGHTAMPSMAGKNPFAASGQRGGFVAATAANGFLGPRSPLCGGPGGSPFERFDPAQRPVVGLRYQLGNWGGREVIAKLEPVFDRSATGDDLLMARAGYQVGGLLVDSRELVHAVKVIFVHTPPAAQGTGAGETGAGDVAPSQAARGLAEQPAGQLPAEPSYESEWIGIPAQGSPQSLGGRGKTVVGLYGRQGIVTDAVGLLFADVLRAEF